MQLDSSQILAWSKEVDIDLLLNKKGATYRTLALKDMNLNRDDKISWLEKNHMLFKRPIVQSSKKLVIAFDEEFYKKTFL